ncbi:MAG: Vacuolar protein sorting-associated protein 13A [Paramarteilia canceri]
MTLISSVVRSVLQRLLSDFFADLDDSLALSLNILSGKLNLYNLRLKKNVLKQFGLPFPVEFSYIDKLELNWSITSFKIDIIVHKVIVIVDSSFTNLKYDFKSNIEDFSSVIHSKISSTYEEVGQKVKDDSDPGFMEKLIFRAIENTFISIEDIHIRLETQNENKSYDFAFGVMMKSFDIKTSDEKNLKNDISMIRKDLHLSKLSLYHDNTHHKFCRKFKGDTNDLTVI